MLAEVPIAVCGVLHLKMAPNLDSAYLNTIDSIEPSKRSKRIARNRYSSLAIRRAFRWSRYQALPNFCVCIVWRDNTQKLSNLNWLSKLSVKSAEESFKKRSEETLRRNRWNALKETENSLAQAGLRWVPKIMRLNWTPVCVLFSTMNHANCSKSFQSRKRVTKRVTKRLQCGYYL